MGLTLDDLVALVKQRGTAETFPEKEELYGLLDPFRDLPDQESLRLALSATVRKGDRLVARVAAEALAYLGKEASGPLLMAIAMDESLGTSQRAAAVWAMDRHLSNFRQQLSSEEHFICMSLPVFEMLEDPEADQGFGLSAMQGSFHAMPTQARDAFLSAITQASRARGYKMAKLAMHLLADETDGERRLRLLDLAADDCTQEAVDMLATFAAGANNREEAKHARRHLHLLRAKGLRGVVRADLRESRALVTGVDGDACFAVNLIVPRVPTFDLVNLLFHLETGLRDGFVMQNLPTRSVDDLIDRVKQGCGTVAAFVPMPLAARMVDEAMAVSRPTVAEDPELAEVIAAAEPALVEARKDAFDETHPVVESAVTAKEVNDLLDGEGFESWFFETHEGTVQKATALMLDKPIRSKGKARAKAMAGRLAKATADLVGRLRADKEHLRLQKMLRHQARLFDCVEDKKRAELCRKLAVEVERPESTFLAAMAVRALMESLERTGEEERPVRFVEARGHLRARLGPEGHGFLKRDVACLDMAAAAHTEMVICNREAPSSQRVPLSGIEAAALAVGEIFTKGVLAREKPKALFEAVASELDRRDLFSARKRTGIVGEIMSGMASFRESICEESCPHRCFEEPDGDGRAAFYVEGAPWRDSDTPPPRGRRNKA